MTTTDPPRPQRRTRSRHDRRLPGLRGDRERDPAGLLHADLQRHRRPPLHPRRRRQLVRGRAAGRLRARRPDAGPARRPDRAPPGAAAVHGRHRARVVGGGVRAVLRDLPRRVGDPGLLRRLAAARGLDHPPPHGRHRPAGTPDPAGRRVPGRCPRARRHRGRAHQWRPRRVQLDDGAADDPGDRGEPVLRGRLVRRRSDAARADGAPGPARLLAGLAGDRAGDGRSDPGAPAGTRVAVPWCPRAGPARFLAVRPLQLAPTSR